MDCSDEARVITFHCCCKRREKEEEQRKEESAETHKLSHASTSCNIASPPRKSEFRKLDSEFMVIIACSGENPSRTQWGLLTEYLWKDPTSTTRDQDNGNNDDAALPWSGEQTSTGRMFVRTVCYCYYCTGLQLTKNTFPSFTPLTCL